MSAHVSRIHAGDSRAIVLCATPLQDRTGSSDSTVCIICLLPEKASKRRWRAGLTLNNRLAIRSLDDSKRPVLHVLLHCCVVELAADQPLSVKNSVARVHSDLVLCCISDKTLCVCESNV